MDVVVPRPPAHPRDGLEWGGEGDDLYLVLRERARELRLEASRTVAHSRALKLVLDERQGGRLASRCVWCCRYRVDGQWVAVRNVALGAVGRTMHTVCEDCAAALRAAG